MSHLQKKKSQGGLDSPIFFMYYLANQLQFINKWMHNDLDNEAWMDLEQHDSKDIKLSDLPFIGLSIIKHCLKIN